MEQEESPKTISISQARSKRESSPKIETTADELRQIFTDVVDQQLTAKIARLETSINRMIDHIEAVKSGTAEDAALRVTTDQDATDLALAKINLPREDYYPYTCGLLASKLKVRNHDVVKMVGLLNMREDKKYHSLIQTGNSSHVSKWSEAAYVRLREALQSGEYEVPDLSSKSH